MGVGVWLDCRRHGKHLDNRITDVLKGGSPRELGGNGATHGNKEVSAMQVTRACAEDLNQCVHAAAEALRRLDDSVDVLGPLYGA